MDLTLPGKYYLKKVMKIRHCINDVLYMHVKAPK